MGGLEVTMAIIHQFKKVDSNILALFETARNHIFRPRVAEDKGATMKELISKTIVLSGENPHDLRVQPQKS